MNEERLSVLHSHPPAGEDAVKLLKEALEEAEAGNLGALAMALVYRDGSTNRCWSRSSALATLLGAISRLQYDLLRFDE